MIFKPEKYTTVFLSYDEPNCETLYNHAQDIFPNIKRVHGVKGIDTAHKECARLAETNRVTILDGDNVVDPKFFTYTWTIRDSAAPHNRVFSFSALNRINGNKYGNGGIKNWPVEMLLNIKTHENSEEGKHELDFDYKNYLEFNYAASTIHDVATAYQAFRAGYRESIKLFNTLLYKDIDYKNLDRLWRWMHVGMDHEVGIYAMLGSRYSLMQLLKDRGEVVKEAYNIEKIYDDIVRLHPHEDQLVEVCNQFGKIIRAHTHDNNIQNILSIDASTQYKKDNDPPLRSTQEFLDNEYQL